MYNNSWTFKKVGNKKFKDITMNLNDFVDCHVHCNYSQDSAVTPEYVIEHAVSRSLAGITLTDHMDLDSPNSDCTLLFDVPQRAAHLHALKEQYKNKINVYLGIELGVQPHVVEQSKKIITSNEFDCVILSIHSVDKCCLWSQKTFFEGKSQHEAFRRYLEEVYWSVTSFDDFDIVGHIGYIRRYGNYPHNDMPYNEYSDIIDAILTTVIKKEKAVEANSSGFAYNLDGPIPSIDILRRYKELGGHYITIGSDSHKGLDVGQHFETTIDLIKSVGFTHITYFAARQPHLVPITQKKS